MILQALFDVAKGVALWVLNLLPTVTFAGLDTLSLAPLEPILGLAQALLPMEAYLLGLGFFAVIWALRGGLVLLRWGTAFFGR
jgi:hypothetical protein